MPVNLSKSLWLWHYGDSEHAHDFLGRFQDASDDAESDAALSATDVLEHAGDSFETSGHIKPP